MSMPFSSSSCPPSQPQAPHAQGQPQAHGAQGQPQPPHAPGQPQPAPAPAAVQPQHNGTAAWALGFLSYLPIPFFNFLITGLVQFFVGRSQIKHGGVAAENGRRAANWGLTQVTWFVLLLVSVSPLFIGYLVTGDESYEPPTWMAVPAMAMVGIYFVLGILSLVYSVAGTVIAAQGRAARLPAIPFLRAKR